MPYKTRGSISPASGAADLLPMLDQFSPNRLSRQLRRLRDIGVIKRVHGDLPLLPHQGSAGPPPPRCARLTEAIIIPAMI